MPRWLSSRRNGTADTPDRPPVPLPAGAGPALLSIARSSIATRLGMPDHPSEPTRDPHIPEWLHSPGACFVTLETRGQLHGCIGSLHPSRELRADVAHNAQAAAFGDPRFPELTADELPETAIEVSVLSPMTRLVFTDEADALAQLRIGVDGVVFACQGKRSTFLPQVWQKLPDPTEFLGRLKVKAGFPLDYWHDSVTLDCFTVAEFHETCTNEGDAT